jgi:peptide/nickel transport system substrate-binding protein
MRRYKNIRNAAIAVALVLAFAACGSDDPADDAATGTTAAPATTEAAAATATTAAPAATDAPTTTAELLAPTTTQQVVEGGPVFGGTLLSMLGENPPHFNPEISTALPVSTPSVVYAEGLVELDSQLMPRPKLAESWEVNEDATQYTFNLRDDVLWHDGEQFTSEDVKYTFENLLPLNPVGQSLAERIVSIETPDDFTVIMNFADPEAALLVIIEQGTVLILAEHVFNTGEDIATHPANFAPIGTGPFKFESFTAGEELVFVRNDDWWGGRRGEGPYLDQVIFQIIPDSTSAINAIRAGEIDTIPSNFVDSTQLAAVRDDPNIALVPVSGSESMKLLQMNHLREELGNATVRQAILHALDRGRILEAAFGGDGRIAESSIPSSFGSFYQPSTSLVDLYPFDTDKANELLDSTPYQRGADGTRFELSFKFSPDRIGGEAIGDILKAGLAEVGIDVSLDILEEQVLRDELFIERDFDMAFMSYTSTSDPASGIHRVYICDEERRIFNNPTGYCNPELDEIFARAATGATREARDAAYYEAQDILSVDIPTIVMVYPEEYRLVRTEVQNIDEQFDVSTLSEVSYAEVWFAE